MPSASSFWRGKRVWLSGHTGFQGTWLWLWLKEMGADVYGFSLEPCSDSVFKRLALNFPSDSQLIADIRHFESVQSSFYASQPEIVFHFAEQRRADDIRAIWETQTLGALNVLESIRATPSVKVVQIMTSGDCYENKPPYCSQSEEFSLGGRDVYGASHAAVEHLVHAYAQELIGRGVSIATCRSAGVVGLGDNSDHALIPYLVKMIQRAQSAPIRFPNTVKSLQIVLEPLLGYLNLAKAQWMDAASFSGAWNFAPSFEQAHTLKQIAETFYRHWTYSSVPELYLGSAKNEFADQLFLQLDSLKAWSCLGWSPRFSFEETMRWTAQGVGQYLYGSSEDLLCWMRASILGYAALDGSTQEVILEEHYIEHGLAEAKDTSTSCSINY